MTIQRRRVAVVGAAAVAIVGFYVAAAAQEQEASPPPDRLAEILEELGMPFAPPGLSERLHVGRVEPPVVEGTPPSAPGFMPAEWEPAIGVFVVWPRNLPEDLLVALADNVPLYVLTEEGTEAEATAWFAERLERSRFRILPGPKSSDNPRDMGPQMVFDGDGRAHFVLAADRGAPQFGLDTSLARRDEPTLTLWNAEELNGQMVTAAGRQLGIPLLRFPGFLTGGNFVVDGLGAAFYSDAQLDENYPLLPPRDFERAIGEYLGIDRPGGLENFAAFGIQHIDTWMKVLDPHRLLVMRPPPGHAEEAPTERNLELLGRMRAFDGRPWQVLRIDTPAVARPREWPRHVGTAAYTNSLILNDTIYVPLYGIAEDEAALSTWRSAMPGYQVRGFEFDEWRTFDAIHCRARAVFDPGMLRIAPLPVEELSADKLGVGARIVAHSESALKTDELLVHWRHGDIGKLATTSLVADGDSVYRAALPRPQPGSRLEYYITAADLSGRRQSAPPVAPAAIFSFVGGPSQP